jgi:FkbM family methyltransferase
MAVQGRFLIAYALDRKPTRMNLLKPLTTPAYFFRPRQMVHRLKRAFRRAPLGEFETVTLPWGAPLRVRPTEVIGSNIWCYGIFDLVVCEAICRLLDQSETAVDIGANIGQMTSLMRYQAGKDGRVFAFEPHPDLFSELQHNIEIPQAAKLVAPADLRNLALSDVAGEASLDVGPCWSVNRGTPRLISATGNGSGRIVSVKTGVLDQIFDDRTTIGVCKIDIEGHELQALRGANRLLQDRRVRDIIFEDFGAYPSPVHQLLLDRGFTIFSLHTRLWRPRLAPASQRLRFRSIVDGENYVATLDPARAATRFAMPGWRALRKIKCDPKLPGKSPDAAAR